MNTIMTSWVRLIQLVYNLNVLSKNTKNKLDIKYILFNGKLLNYHQIILQNHYRVKNCSPLPNNSGKSRIEKRIHSTIEQKLKYSCIDILTSNQLSPTCFNSFLNETESPENVASLESLFLLHRFRELQYSKGLSMKENFINDMWKELERLDIPLYTAHYNCLLAIYDECDYEFCPIKFLQKMLNNNIKPDVITLERLISQFCKQGKMKESNELLTYMEIKKIIIHENVLCSVLDGYLRTNDIEAANIILNKMMSLQIRCSIQTYTILLNNSARNGDIPNIRKILAVCKVKNIWIPDKVYLETVYNLSLNGFTSYVDEILLKISKVQTGNKEANRIIYKLIEKQQEDIAFKIFQLYSENNLIPENGIDFLKTLINFDLVTEKASKYLQFMKEKGMDEKIFISLLNNNNNNSTFMLINMWKNLGYFITEKYFYSILNTAGKTNQIKDIEKVLQKMVAEFQIQPSINMLIKYILPYMQHDSQETWSRLVNCQINSEKASNAIVLRLLSEHKIRESFLFMNNNYTQYKTETLKYPLLEAFRTSKDVSSFIAILHYLYIAGISNQNSAASVVRQKYLYQQFIDSCIFEAVNLLSTGNSYTILMLFQNLRRKGLGLSEETIKKVERVLIHHMSSTYQTSLRLLKSDNVVAEALNINYKHQFQLLDLEKLENMPDLLVRTDLINLLFHYYTSTKSENKILQLLKVFKKTGKQMSIQEYISMIKMYLNLYKLDEAEFWIQKSTAKFPGLHLPNECYLKLVIQYLANDNIEKALAWLESTTIFSTSSKENYISLSSNEFNCKDEKLIKLLKSYDSATIVSTKMFNAFINYYLRKNDLEAAVSFLEYVYKTYNLIPRDLKLVKNCILQKNMKLLERATNVLKNNYSDSKIDFVIALTYLDINEEDLAKYLLENCKDLSEKDIFFYAEKYYQLGNVNKLEKLIKIFDELKYNVDGLYLLLLKTCYYNGKWSNILIIRSKMIQNKIKPSPNFMEYMNLAMIRNNNILHILHEFQKAIEEKDYVKAKGLLPSIPLLYKSDYYSILCWKLVKTGDITEVLDLCQDLKEKFQLELNLSTAEFVLKKLLSEDNVDYMERIGQYFSQDFKRQVNYSYYLNLTYLRTGSWNLYFKKFNSKPDKENLIAHDLNINKIIVVRTLLIYPELISQFELLSCKYDSKDEPVVIIAIWMYYILINNPHADNIWIGYNLKDAKNSSWLQIFYFLQTHKNFETYLKCIQLLQESDIKRNAKLFFVSKLIQYCIDSDQSKNYEYGLKCLQCAMKEFSMTDFDMKMLANLQMNLEKSGIAWPWNFSRIKP